MSDEPENESLNNGGTNAVAFGPLQIDKRSNRSKDNLSDLADVLSGLKPSCFKDSHLISYKVSKRKHVMHASIWI